MNSEDIKKIRGTLGLSQEALAHLVGVSIQTVGRWERGLFTPSRLAEEKIKRLKVKK